MSGLSKNPSAAQKPETINDSREAEAEVLRSIRELKFGAVEVVVHQGRVAEIRQTLRRRFVEPG